MRVSRSLMSPSYWRRSIAPESGGGDGESFVALNDRHSHKVSSVVTVEFTGADDERRTLRDLTGQGPSVEALLRTPEVEGTFGHRRVHAERAKGVGHHGQARPVALTLKRHVIVIAECDGNGRLDRCGHHEPRVLAHRLKKSDQILVTGVEAGAHAGEVRSLGARVQCEDAVGAVFEN